MAAISVFSSHLFVLVLNCYLGASSGRTVRRGPRSAPQDGDLLLMSPLDEEGSDRGMVFQHMFKLYDKYNRENRLREGNTARSFQASQDSPERGTYLLNLTSLQDTELILSATFHFLSDRRPRQKAWFCKRFKNPACHSLPVHPFPSVSLLLRAVPSGSGLNPRGSLLGNVTFHPHRRGAWQMRDVTEVVKEARGKGHALLSVELDFGQQYQRQQEEAALAENLPYLLLYADDRALAEANSVAASLQRYDPFPEGGGHSSHSSHSSHLPRNPNSSPDPSGRVRREAAPASAPVQNNELPGVDHGLTGYRKADLWESTWHLAFKPKAKPGVTTTKDKKRKTPDAENAAENRGVADEQRGEQQTTTRQQTSTTAVPRAVDETTSLKKKAREKDGKPLEDGERRADERRDGGRKKGGGGRAQSPVLSFDERTMQKARRRQWGGGTQHRGCSRRNLRVDFADIGWSEWVVAPKAFDAFYCAGTCGFPMPKVVRPSNHATIQGIVRAVGIIPGVPEPCCVPEKMSPLAVLYQDEGDNLVLKVYPNMSVQSCSCR